MDQRDQWVEASRQFGVQLTKTQVEQFGMYESLLLEWNQKFNLTAIRELADIQQRHFLDSMTFGLLAREEVVFDGAKLIDIGTGAGFPGLAIKIAFPEIELTLVDSVAKKVSFLSHVIKKLRLKGATAIADRAESIGQAPNHREKYDIVVARSVAYMPVLAEYLLPLARVGGNVIAFKGERATAEADEAAAAIEILGGKVAEIIPIDLGENLSPRALVRIEKVVKTPEKYPRKPGRPLKRPLGA